jgi:tRNA pseudouridine55 synthase
MLGVGNLWELGVGNLWELGVGNFWELGVGRSLGFGGWPLGIDPLQLCGALLVDKPCGPTSHDVVAFVRRTLKTPRVGHTGTLDPLATGLLVLLVGHATRVSQFLVTDEKEYIADVRLGVATPTYDAQSLADGVRWSMIDDRWPMGRDRGPISDGRWPMDVELETVLAEFRGSFLQMPPPYSAKKVAGVAAYEKARKNQPVDLKAVPVTVRELEVLDTSTIDHRSSPIDHPSAIDHRSSDIDPGGLLRLRVVVSAGFYVRSLAHDIGQRLGCGAHLEALRRTRVGAFRVEDAATLDTLQAAEAPSNRLIPLNALLGDMPAVSLTDEGVRRAGNGNSLAPRHLVGSVLAPPESSTRVRLVEAAGALLGVAEWRADGLLHPVLVLR